MVPFNTTELDDLLEKAGVDVVVATTKHAVQHLLGGYRYFFFANMDAIGLGRYLPALGYRRGAPEDAFYVGAANEDWGTDVAGLWVPEVRNVSWSGPDTARAVAAALRKRGLDRATVAVELAFLPADAWDTLRTELPDARFVDGLCLLEELRAVKSPAELDLVRRASEGIIDAMLATFQASRPGQTKAEIVERFRREQTDRGMVFDYCLAAVGTNMNRAPSDQVWQEGETLSLDSGGMYRGYIGDLARMAVAGDPTPLMADLLEQIEAVQLAARAPVRAGARGSAIFTAAEQAIAALPHGPQLRFVAHGMGLITHEAPRLTGTGPVPYPADHADVPLRAGQVISIETWIESREAGFIKLEDTLIVTAAGWEAPGDVGRGWNRPAGPTGRRA
ncbi:M24 family metallopeptidase [Dactylosporangium sucinum]|uniref:Peptidase n=1 Tax=Dactylosporangium sucinum TaxID=1424081 RepID=A0A917TT60_9ACTN|nr:Xaa-Pro peptidase family protein [Dactylosporangium sucinum]GGM36430.1 peptidase [Dactylosporangium sucinum]